MKIKKGDTVKILTGKDRLKTGKILRVFIKEGKIIVEGLNIFKKTGGQMEKVDIDDLKPGESFFSVFDLSVGQGSNWILDSDTPIYVFGEINKIFTEYMNKILDNPDTNQMLDEAGFNVLSLKKYFNQIHPSFEFFNEDKPKGGYGHPVIPVVKHPDIKPLRWCHAELALVPTKRSLNILFFETE